MKTVSTERKKWQIYCFGEKMFLGYTWMSPERVLVRHRNKSDRVHSLCIVLWLELKELGKYPRCIALWWREELGGGGICILRHWQLMEAICTGICHGNKLTRTPFFCSHTSQSSNVGRSNNQMKNKSAYQMLMVTRIGVLCKAVWQLLFSSVYFYIQSHVGILCRQHFDTILLLMRVV